MWNVPCQCHGSNDWFPGKTPRQEGAGKLSPTGLRGSLIEENGLEISGDLKENKYTRQNSSIQNDTFLTQGRLTKKEILEHNSFSLALVVRGGFLKSAFAGTPIKVIFFKRLP